MVPYYSATLYDPRDEPFWDADYWVDNLRHTVRFAAAVQAALEDGFRVFGELAPHPLLTHAVDQTARSLDISMATMAALRREQELPYGLRAFLADLHSAGAAVDFSVLYPEGRLVDAPLPTWTHVPLILARDANRSHTQGGQTLAVHPCWRAHVRLPEDPERHVWQSDVGTDTHPWLGTTRSTTWPHCPAPPTARWRWQRRVRSSATTPGTTSPSTKCCCSTRKVRCRLWRQCRRRATSTSPSRPTRTAQHSSRIPSLSKTEGGDPPAAYDIEELWQPTPPGWTATNSVPGSPIAACSTVRRSPGWLR